MAISIHSWLVRVDGHTVLIDTASGNDKKRPQFPGFHHQSHPYLERLAAAGVRSEDVDYVLLTHLHSDHCGWNTRLEGGRWVPTFPNAQYFMPRVDADYYASPASHNKVNIPSQGNYEDSVAPIIEAGLARYIEAEGGTVLSVFEYQPTGGHSLGHMAIRLRSGGQDALFWDDVLHSPAQASHPEWNSVFDEFLPDSEAARRAMLAQAAGSHPLVLTTHFPSSSAGHVRRQGDAYTWTYA